ncbi:SusC/RagA family TonB-linked outer membrane protein [Roseivirga sp. BDSF3-8]|uniref:SusC/RagA family TonB-linked outer membrane protein n=1 Tax=Roseivirga sp. BDSF3-8 TaxID=3241598 RepID=UPI003531E2EE
MKRILLISFVLVSALISEAWAQRTVSGKVTSAETGEAIPGVTVIVKGNQSVGTVTEIDGNYKLAVPEGATTLQFMYIGLQTQEVQIGNRSVIDVAMREDVTQLSEVVVTAIGIEREQKALGYAVTEVGSEKIAQKAEADVLRSISGKVPGVNITGSGGVVGQSTNITIRGNSSLTGNNQPLFVVDGVPFNNDVNASTTFAGGNQFSNRAIDLDPNNIESVTVLKGAAAAALYGSRAANGVVVITTKGAKSGVKTGLEITLSSSYNVEEVAKLPDYTEKYGQGGANSFNRGFVGNWGAPFSDIDSVAHPYSANPGLAVFPEFAGAQVAYEPHNNAEDFFQTGSLFENSITVSSGGEKAAISATISRADNEGIIPNSEFDRTSFNLGTNAQLGNGFFANAVLNYVKSEQKTPLVAPGIAGGSSVFRRLMLTPVSIDLASLPYQDPITGGNVYYRQDQDNPYWVANNNFYTSNVDRYFGKVTLGYDVTDWLTVSYQAGFNAYTDQRKSVTRRGSYETGSELGSMYIDNYSFEEMDGILLFAINKDLNEDFSFSANVGHNANQRTFTNDFVNGNEFIAFGIDYLNNTVIQTSGEDYNRRRYHAVFADVTLGYRDWAFLNVVARNDWSSTLPQTERSYFYPGVSGSVVFTDAFDIQSNVLSYGKLRAGYTRVGNEAGPYQVITTVQTNYNPGVGGTEMGFPFTVGATTYNNQSISNTEGNPNLKPEFTTEFEVGADLKFFQNRIGLDATYFHRSSTDQIVNTNLAPTTGSLGAIINVGEVENKGFEVGLDVTPVSTASGFTWNVYAAFTHIDTEVIDLGEDTNQIVVGGYSNLGIVHREGLPYGQILGSAALRAEDGNFLINQNTGLLIEDPDLQIIGDPNPDFTLGITNTLSYKGVTLTALFDWRQGGDLYSFTANQTISRGVLSYNDDRRDVARIIPGYLSNSSGEPILDEDGNLQENNIPVSVNEMYFIDGLTWFDDLLTYDATVIRLREVTLGYSLPKSVLESTPFGRASITLSGRNLFFFTPNIPEEIGLDPEVSALGSGNGQGLEFLNAPTTRRYGVNISVSF